MSQCDHKRQRSLQYSSVRRSKMRMALNHLEALKRELDGAEATEEDLDIISEHFDALEEDLKGASKPRIMVTLEDLHKAGVMHKRLVFFPEKLTELSMALSTKQEAEIADLHTRIKNIYEHVNMAYETSSRMVIEAILTSLAEIASTDCTGVVILPGMEIGPSHGAHWQVVNPTSGFELCLSGNVDYAIIEYKDVSDYKLRMLGSRKDAINLATGCFLLAETKRPNDLFSHTPEAVSQAIAFLKSANLTEIRFCISDGDTWIFFILKSENGSLTYYESVNYLLRRNVVRGFDIPLRELVKLLCEWLKPTTTGLFFLH